MRSQSLRAALLLGSIPLFAPALASCGAARPIAASVSAVAPVTTPPSQEVVLPPLPRVLVDITPSHARGSFRPLQALGAGIDRMAPQLLEPMYSKAALAQIQSSGYGEASYRLNTELHVEAWHWNPKGKFSDASAKSGKGYFIGDAAPADPIATSYGFTLPRRGFTRNEGTESHGFSRMTDGDPKSFWKSNPYLEKEFTKEEPAYPQWVVIDLEKVDKIDTLRVTWGAPYARAMRVQYWTGEDAIKKPARGEWHDFTGGSVKETKGGTATYKLADAPLDVRWVRMLLTESSNTCDPKAAADKRNCVGYAIHELSLGTSESKSSKSGKTSEAFHDVTRHSADQKQTATFCSSVDPWHQASDIAEHQGVQTGLDKFYTSGATRGLPAMIPIALLYGTPEDAAAEIAYVEKRGYPISYVEMGEEADGQYMTPEHYGALYLQFATALHAVDPKLKLGGPAFTGVNEDIKAWADARGNTSWLARFMAYLKAHGRTSDLAFLSFEHYPFEPCAYDWNALYDEPKLITGIMDAWRNDGIPADLPLLATEVNIAWQSDQPFVDTFGALWLADYTGAFFAAGGTGTYYFHYFPTGIYEACGTAGGFTMFTVKPDLSIAQPTSQYFASRMLTTEWTVPGDAPHVVAPVVSEVRDEKGRVAVTAYAVHRPDDEWSVLLVNKDPERARDVHLAFQDQDAKRDHGFAGGVHMATFGAETYTWHPPVNATNGANGKDGYADPDGPIAVKELRADKAGSYTLPRASITVLRGKLD